MAVGRAHVEELRAAIEERHEDVDHLHTDLASVTAKSRLDSPKWFTVAPRADGLMTAPEVPRRTLVVYAARPRADPEQSLPPQSRAPPLG